MVRYVSQRSFAGHQWTKHIPLKGGTFPMFDDRLGTHDKILFAALDYFNREGVHNPTLKAIRVLTGMSPQTVKRSTEWLVETGWLEVERDYSVSTKVGQSVITYKLWYTDDFKWQYEHP